MIPVKFKTTKAEEYFRDYLVEQLDAAEQDSSEMRNNLVVWDNMYECKAAPKTFPWPGCSNIIVPLTATAIDTIQPRILGTMLATKPYEYIKARVPELTEWASSLQDFMQYWFEEQLDLYGVLCDGAHYMVKNGTVVLKNIWTEEKVPRMFYDSKGRITKTEVVTYRGPKWHLVPLQDLLIPANAKTLQDALFLSHASDIRWKTIEYREKHLKMYRPGVAEKLKGHEKTAQDVIEPVDRESLETQGIKITNPWLFELCRLDEVWTKYDVEDDGMEVPIMVTFHRPSKTICRSLYHPYFHMQRPFMGARYVRRPNQFFGLGVAQMLRMLNEELSTIHNQTLDSATVANIKCFKAKKNRGISANEKAYPGKIFMLDDLDDLQEFALGEIKASSFQLEENVELFAEKRSGVNDYTLGRESGVLKSRATARGTLALISEGNRNFDLKLREFRAMLDEGTKQNVELHQQLEPGGKEWIRGTEVFKQMFPQVDVRRRLQFACSAADAAMNKQVEQEVNLMMLERAVNVYKSLMEMLQMATNPQAPPEVKTLALDSAKSYHKLATRALKSLNINDTENYLPKVPENVSTPTQPPGVQPPPGADLFRRMAANLPPGAGGVPGGGQQGPPGRQVLGGPPQMRGSFGNA